MRRITIVSLAIVAASSAAAAACSTQDQKSPTAPAATSTSVSASQSPTSAPIAAAKPSQGLKVTRVTSGWVSVAANASATASINCPDGTTMTGGGYGFAVIGAASAPAFVRGSAGEPDQNGWFVSVMNYAVGAAPAMFNAIAFCAS